MSRTKKQRPIDVTRERSIHVAERRDDNTGDPYYYSSDRRVPAIRISGRWLQQLGFTTGTRVTITPERRRLVLTIAE
jgi:toxic protein SymE